MENVKGEKCSYHYATDYNGMGHRLARPFMVALLANTWTTGSFKLEKSFDLDA